MEKANPCKISVYIHIPFCLKKCGYCDFCSTSDQALLDQYLESLVQEINQTSERYHELKIDTIYFGGGTPSILSPVQLERVVTELSKVFTFGDNMEFTLEANPETVLKENLIGYKNLGVNRISVGVQSFDPQELKYLGRVHSVKKANEALNLVSDHFDNFNIDLIHSLPYQKIESVLQNIEVAVKFNPPHISCYELSYEEGTPLYTDKKNKNENDAEIYRLVKKSLKDFGYKQYEISNYSKEGFECQHNLAYWSNDTYIGYGLASHSYDKERSVRWANSESMSKYLSGRIVDFVERSKDVDAIIMGLRKNSGIPFENISNKHRDVLNMFIEKGWLVLEKGRVSFSEEGRLFANQVLIEFV